MRTGPRGQDLTRQERIETLYYGLLQSVPPLQQLLPCTATYHFSKQSA